MKKRILLLTLVLVMALSSSVFAGVTLHGNLHVEFLSYDYEFFNNDKTHFWHWWNLHYYFANNDGANWSVDGRFHRYAMGDDYGLEWWNININDQHFNLKVGNRVDYGWRGDNFGFISVGGWRDTEQAVLTVPVQDVANVIVDYHRGTAATAFATFNFAGNSFGVAGQKRTDSEKDTVNVYGTFKLDVATINAIAGITTTAEDKNLAYGVRAYVPFDGGSVEAQYTSKDVNYLNGNATGAYAKVNFFQDSFTTEARVDLWGPKAGLTDTKVSGNVVYENTYRAEAYHQFNKNNANTSTGLTAFYRAPGVTTWWHDMHLDWVWHTLPGFGARADVRQIVTDATVYEADVKVAGPFGDGLGAYRVQGFYKSADKSFNAVADAKIVASDKVTIWPTVGYNFATEDVTLQGKVEYKIGTGGTLITTTAKYNTGEKSFHSKVTIPF